MYERAMEMEILDASARMRRRGRRLTGEELSRELTTLHNLQKAALSRPDAWRIVCARVGSAAAWWVLQLALAVASTGLASSARSLLSALPGLPGQAAHAALLDGLIASHAAPLMGVA